MKAPSTTWFFLHLTAIFHSSFSHFLPLALLLSSHCSVDLTLSFCMSACMHMCAYTQIYVVYIDSRGFLTDLLSLYNLLLWQRKNTHQSSSFIPQNSEFIGMCVTTPGFLCRFLYPNSTLSLCNNQSCPLSHLSNANDFIHHWRILAIISTEFSITLGLIFNVLAYLQNLVIIH